MELETEEHVAQSCLSIAEELTGSRFGFLTEVNDAGRFDTWAISMPGWRACNIPRDEVRGGLRDLEVRGLRGSVIKSGEPVIENNPKNHKEWIPPPKGHPSIDNFMGVPLRYKDKIVGMIGLANKKGGYDKKDITIIENLSVPIIEVLYKQRSRNLLITLNKAHRTLSDVN